MKIKSKKGLVLLAALALSTSALAGCGEVLDKLTTESGVDVSNLSAEDKQAYDLVNAIIDNYESDYKGLKYDSVTISNTDGYGNNQFTLSTTINSLDSMDFLIMTSDVMYTGDLNDGVSTVDNISEDKSQYQVKTSEFDEDEFLKRAQGGGKYTVGEEAYYRVLEVIKMPTYLDNMLSSFAENVDVVPYTLEGNTLTISSNNQDTSNLQTLVLQFNESTEQLTSLDLNYKDGSIHSYTFELK